MILHLKFFLLMGVLLFSLSTSTTPALSQDFFIPDWIRNNAGWWADRQIDDDTFVNGIKFLIEQNIIQIPPTVSTTFSSQSIPDWVRNNAGLWADRQIDDDTFVNGITFLIESNIFSVTQSLIKTELPLMIPILNIEDPQSEIKLVKKFLKPGDIFIFPPTLYSDATKLKNEIAGLELGTGGISFDVLKEGISRIPSNVKYVTYDYEPDFTPEWTDDQSKSIEYFSQLHAEAKKYEKKLVIVPVYYYGLNWDWGEVAKHTDILLIQVQNYQRGGNFPEKYIPDESLIDITKKLVKQIDEKSPNTQLFLQIGFAFGSQPLDVLQDINDVTELGIDGFTLLYNPGTSGKTSKFPLLEETLEKLDRS